MNTEPMQAKSHGPSETTTIDSQSKITAGRANCFDLLRLILAGLVVYSHSYFVGGFGEEWFSRMTRGQTIAGTVGVLGFFGLSGFLVGDSAIRCASPIHFFRRRILRIMPGFWMCLLVTAFVIAPLIMLLRRGSINGFAWYGDNSAASYVAANALLRVGQWTVDDSLAGAAQPGDINGSLWSLFLESCCYIALAVLGGCGLLVANRLWLLVGTGLLAVFHTVAVLHITLPSKALPALFELSNSSPFILAFFVGALCRAYAASVSFGRGGAVFFGLITLLLLRLGGYQIAAPVVVTLLLLNLGHSFKIRLRHDFSYGVYVYSFPCQQLLACMSGATTSLTVFLLASFGLTAVFAAASWFGVERHFLTREKPPTNP